MTKAELIAEADRIERTLKETKEGLKHTRSIQSDIVDIVVPMLKDQLRLIKAVIEAM